MRWGRRIEDAVWNGRSAPVIFLTSGYLLGVSINLISNIAAELEGFLWWLIILAGPILFLIVTSHWWARLFTGDIEASASMKSIEPKKGLVVFAGIGPGIETARKTIEYHLPQLQRVWLFYSTGGMISSEESALQLRRDLIKDSILRPDQILEVPMHVDSFEDPEQVKDAIEDKVYGELPAGMRPDDIVIDITGGRKTTTAGAFLAGLPRGRHLEYNSPSEINIRGQGVKPGIPIQISLDYELRKLKRR